MTFEFVYDYCKLLKYWRQIWSIGIIAGYSNSSFNLLGYSFQISLNNSGDLFDLLDYCIYSKFIFILFPSFLYVNYMF